MAFIDKGTETNGRYIKETINVNSQTFTKYNKRKVDIFYILIRCKIVTIRKLFVRF